MKIEKIIDSKSGELQIFIGQSAKENWEIIERANQYDIWFHLNAAPSCHVVLKLPSSKSTVSKRTLDYCAMLCKENSKFASFKDVKVMYTVIKNVTKGDAIGSVYTKKTEILTV